MTPPPAPATGRAVLTAAQERALVETIRAGRRARLLAQRHLATRLRRELPPTVSARAAAVAVLAALLPRLPLAPAQLPATVGPLLPHGLDNDPAAVARALDGWPLDQDALRAAAAARAAFVAANHGLVVAVAARYQHRGLLLDDLVQEGTVGLLRAIDLFDPARGYKFSTLRRLVDYAGDPPRRGHAGPPRPRPRQRACRTSAPASPARPMPSTPPWAIRRRAPTLPLPWASPAPAWTPSPRPCPPPSPST